MPLTRLSSTNPPAFSILFLSSILSGLWSILSSLETTFLGPDLSPKTALESPEFPTIISVAVIIAEQAVQPVPLAMSPSGLP